MAAFNVRLNRKSIDTVFYGESTTCDEVRQSLINHDGYDPAITVNRKTAVEFIVQGNYGYGWDDLTASTDQKEARADLRDYRANDPAPTRLIRRRVKV